MKKLFVILATLLLLSIIACGGDGGGDTPANGNNTLLTSAKIGPSGGTIATTDGAVSLTIPAGALSSETNITISATGETGPVGKVYDFGPSGTVFFLPITVTLAYDKTTLPANMTEEDLYLATETFVGSYHEPLTNITIDKVNATITGTLTHFSHVFVTHGSLVVGKDGQAITVDKIPLATSFRLPIGDPRDFNSHEIKVHDPLSQSADDLGADLSLFNIGIWEKTKYPNITFNASATSNQWYVSVAFKTDLWLSQGQNDVTGSYGAWHTGNDWNNSKGGYSDLGMPVHAIANGIVLFNKKDVAFGNIIVIGHKMIDDKIIASVYAHMKELSPYGVGETVNKGDVIGKIGDTGKGSVGNCHLHFEIIRTVIMDNASKNVGKTWAPVIDKSSNEIYIRSGWYWPNSESKINDYYEDPSWFIKNHQNVTTGYTVSGQVTYNGAGLPGVTVTLTGASSVSTTTDSSGNYSFINAANGSYTLTVSLAGYSFNPSSQTVTVNGSNVLIASNIIATPQFLNANMIAYYPFNGNANDMSGNGNDGTVYGATLTSDRVGNPNSAFHFDGINSYIQSSLSSLVSNSSFTVAYWMRYELQDNRVWLLYFGNVNGHSYNGFHCLINTNDVYAAEGWNNGDMQNGMFLRFQNRFNILDRLGIWTHVVTTYSVENSTISTYVDGILRDSDAASAFTMEGVGFYIGKLHPSYASIDSPFKGDLDDVRIYNRALSSSEILDLYNNY